MHDLRDLYQEVIIDHNNHPRNFCVLPTANRQAEGFNRLCGDRLTVYLELEENQIKKISFMGKGCAICTASASLMTEQLQGKTSSQANELFENFHTLLTAKQLPSELFDKMGKLTVLAGVRDFPARVKCATLAWHTFHAALKQISQSISTEND